MWYRCRDPLGRPLQSIQMHTELCGEPFRTILGHSIEVLDFSGSKFVPFPIKVLFRGCFKGCFNCLESDRFINLYDFGFEALFSSCLSHFFTIQSPVLVIIILGWLWIEWLSFLEVLLTTGLGGNSLASFVVRHSPTIELFGWSWIRD